MVNSRLHPLPCAAASPDLPGSVGTGGAASADAFQSTPIPTPVQLDAAALGRLMALDPTNESRLIERVMQAFQTSAARLMAQLDGAQPGGERAALRLVAHTLKSSSASIGALALSARCAQLETGVAGVVGVAGVDTPGELAADIAALRLALTQALAAIDALLAERRG